MRIPPALVYDLLFHASADATQFLAKDPRFINGQLGLIGIQHTWGRNLSYHPHIHYLVPAGGLSADHRTWLPAHHHFLLPVKALSRILRAKFQFALQKSSLANDIPITVWKKDWVVHCKPVGNGHTALKYLDSLRLSSRHQQPPSCQARKTPGHLLLLLFHYRPEQVLHPLSR